MTSTSGINSVLASLGLTGGSSASAASNAAQLATNAASTAIDEKDFLTLMTTQLQDQDPTQPVTNAQFFDQIAQFSQVSGMNQLNSSFSALASQLISSQSLQASSLIGHHVLVPSKVGELTSSGLAGAVQVPASGDVQVQIHNSAGALISTIDLGTQSAGTVPFAWDGTASSGGKASAGTYTLTATVGSGGSAQSATTDVSALVQSVSLSSSGVLLNLHGLGQTALSNVSQVE